MAQMKLAIDPRADFAKAPRSVKTLYVALLAMSGLWVAAQIIATINGGNGFALLGNIVLAYLVVDSGLVVLRGKSMGLGLARFWSLLAMIVAGLAVTGVYSVGDAVTGTVIGVGVAGLVVLVLSFLRSTVSHFDARRGEKLVDLKAARATTIAEANSSTAAPKSGSFEDLISSEDGN